MNLESTNKELIGRIELTISIHEYDKRKELSNDIKKYFGKEGYDILMNMWHSRYLSFNAYGIIVFTNRWYLDRRDDLA